MQTLRIAFRNLNRQKKRSVFLIIALAFAFLIVSSIDGLFAGAIRNMELQIAKLVGGHVYIMGGQKAKNKSTDDQAQSILDEASQEAIEKIAANMEIPSLYTIKRTRIEGKLIFENKEARLMLDGCDFNKEPLLKDSLNFKSGSIKNLETTKNGILISQLTAEYLNVELNDTILFESKTSKEQNTVSEFKIAGIVVQKNALAANIAYANIDFANKVYEIPKGNLNFYSYYLKDANKQEEIANKFEIELGKIAKVTNRKQAYEANPRRPEDDVHKQLNEGKWEGTKFAVLSFYDFAPEMAGLLDYISLISLGVLFVLLLITMIGVSNTFKIMVQERRGEVGTMRACGAGKKMIKRLFISEAVLLGLVGAFIGLILSVVVMVGVSYIPIPVDSGFFIFTADGFLGWRLSLSGLLLKTLLILILLVITVYASALRASNMIPAEALRSGK